MAAAVYLVNLTHSETFHMFKYIVYVLIICWEGRFHHAVITDPIRCDKV